jgi:hypothetical protein
MIRIRKKQKEQRAAAEATAQAQRAAEQAEFERERELWKQRKAQQCSEQESQTFFQPAAPKEPPVFLQKEFVLPQEESKKPKPQFFEFPVKGVFNHEEDIFHKLMERNPNYDYTKAELIEYEVPGYPIYKWVPKALPAMLVPEPDNQYDPNAIRVEIGDVLIGYVPKGECRKVLDWIRSSKIDNIAFQITGGAYKLLDEDYDVIKDKSKYTLETGREELAAKVTLRVLE